MLLLALLRTPVAHLTMRAYKGGIDAMLILTIVPVVVVLC
jgi:hypothetical protein